MKPVNVIRYVPFICLSFLVSACSTQPDQTGSTTHTQSVYDLSTTAGHSLHDVAVIPSAMGPKVQSTNQYGSTFSGMGTNVYSRIGSSGVHSAGISTNLESMVKSSGVDGIQILVMDDTVILGQSTNHLTDGGRYDVMQSKVLNGYSGTSGTGPKNQTGITGQTGIAGNSGTKAGAKVATVAEPNSLTGAVQEVHRIFGGNVRVMTLQDPKAVEAISRVKAKMKSGQSPKEIAADINLILSKAKDTK